MKVRNIIFSSIPLLIFILGISYVTSGFGFEGFTNALVAFGTLMLAWVAFLTIRNSNEREKRRREEDERIRNEEKESDFERRCLSDIEDWAEKSIIFLNRLEITRGGYTTKWHKSALQPFTLKSKWMMDASRVFAEDDKKSLLKTVDKAVADLEEYRTGKTVRDIIFKHEELVSSLNKVLACIADLKVKLKL